MAKEQYTKTIYIYDGKEFDAGDMEIEEVRTLLSATFPEISNATTKTEIKDDVRKITFAKTAGTKGAASLELAEKLKTLKQCKFLGLEILLTLTGLKGLDLDRHIKELKDIDEKISKKTNDCQRLISGCQNLQPIQTFSEAF